MAFAKNRKIFVFMDEVDVSDEVKDFTVEAADADDAFLSYAAARQDGVVDYVAKFTAPQDYAVGSIWEKVYTSPGTEVVLHYSTDVATLAEIDATHPAFEATATISIPRGVVFGGETTRSTAAVPTVALEWMLEAKPVKITVAP